MLRITLFLFSTNLFSESTIMNNKILKSLVNLFSAIHSHLALAFAAIFVISAVCIACYAACLYPDDAGFLDAAPGLVKNTGIIKNESIRDNISELGSLVVVPSYSKEIENKISLLRSSGYLKTNPYVRSPYVFRYVTGKTGLWLDEKSSVLLPCGSSMKFSVTPASGSRIEFYAAAVSFTDDKGKRKIEAVISSGGKKQKVLMQDVELYNRREFDHLQTPPSFSFPKIYPSTGWCRLTADISRFKGKEITVEILSPDKEGLIFIGNPLHYAGAEIKKYNVIHVVFDAMNRDYMGIYNPESSLTPNFVKQKNDFIVFNRFYSNATKTRIFLSGMFTSQNPPATRHGYNNNLISNEEKELFYSDKSFDTLPRALNRNGYLTMQIGNSGFTNPALQTSVDYGFSESFDFQAMPYDSTGIAYHLMRILRDHKNKPFYIYAHFNTTHKPRITPLKYYVKGFLQQPDKIWRPNVTGATIHADALFSHITSALKEEGLWDNTILIISSDHGTLFNVSNFNRNFLLEDFVRIPFLLHLPDDLKKRYADGVSGFAPATGAINLGPTILDLTGSPASEGFKGKSIVPYLNMKNPPLYTDEYIRSFDNYAASIIYKGRWKYIQRQYDPRQKEDNRTLKWYFFGGGQSDPDEAIYNLDNDKLEKSNLIGSQKEITDLCRRAFLNGSTHPALTMITIFPDGKPHKVTARTVLKTNILRAGIINNGATETVNIKKNNCDFSLTVSDAPRYIYFEGVESDTPFSVQFFSDGKPLDDNNFLCGVYNLPLASQNSLIEGIPLLSALLVTGKPSAPRDVKGLAVNLSRMDIRRWAKEQKNGDDGKIDANMKEVLKSWGYIQ